jgi:hypothetical protein
MKNLLTAIAIASTTLLFSCHDEVSNMESIKRMEDTLFKSYPTMAGVSVEVKDYHELNVVVRSAQLYSTTPENKQKVSAEIGKMAESVFGTNNELDKGQVIFTKDELSTDMKPKDAQAYPVTFIKK